MTVMADEFGVRPRILWTIYVCLPVSHADELVIMPNANFIYLKQSDERENTRLINLLYCIFTLFILLG